MIDYPIPKFTKQYQGVIVSIGTKTFNAAAQAAKYENRDPKDTLRLALENFENAAISFSGAEDVILIDMAVQIRPDVRVFSLDTGRLHVETYRFMEQVRKHYNIVIDVLSPDAAAVEKLVREKGLFSFYQDGHK